MIRNDRQYHNTRRQRQRLAKALDELTRRDSTEILALQCASLTGQLADLDRQLREYETLRQHRE